MAPRLPMPHDTGHPFTAGAITLTLLGTKRAPTGGLDEDAEQRKYLDAGLRAVFLSQLQLRIRAETECAAI